MEQKQQSELISPTVSDEGFSDDLNTERIKRLCMQLHPRERQQLTLDVLLSMPLQYLLVVMRQLEPRLKPHFQEHVDFISQLPYEIALLVAQELIRADDAQLSSLSAASAVSRHWHECFTSEAAYQALFAVKQAKEGYQLNNLRYSSCRQRPRWRDLFMASQQLKKNWLAAKYETRNFSGHLEGVYTLAYDPVRQELFSGSRDCSVRIWSVESGECIHEIQKAHLQSVLCMQVDERLFVTGSSDATIKIWDRTTLQPIKTLYGHQEGVLNVRFDDRYIVSSSKDFTIKVWDINTYELVRTQVGHTAAVNSVICKNGLMVSASGDRIIKVWSYETGELIRDLVGHLRGIATLQFDGDIIISGSSDTRMIIWNVHTAQMIKSVAAHEELVRTLAFNQQIVVSGGYDKSLKIWSMQNLHHGLEGSPLLLHDLNNVHTSRVYKVEMTWRYLISCAQDGKIVLLDFGCMSNVDQQAVKFLM